MAYYLDLFSPETFEAFLKSPRDVSGVRERYRAAAERVKPGDKLICYLTKLSRWISVLEVIEGPYRDAAPRFYYEDDPFVIRFKVKPLICLPIEQAIPIHEDEIWNMLSFTRGQDKKSNLWTGKVRASLGQLTEADGVFLERKIREQADGGKVYPYDDEQYRKFIGHRIRRADKSVSVSVPEDRGTETDDIMPDKAELRESRRIQALIAKVGAAMGMKIWIPKADRSAVLQEWKDEGKVLLDTLPLNYDETTLKTIEQIDILWLKGRSIVRAFEVEHTTSIYSGILRMADLLALQPNMDIKLHIVAPDGRRDKVFQELKRPVFSLLERGPLAEMCTFISYDSLRRLGQEKHLAHLVDSVLEEYEEEAE